MVEEQLQQLEDRLAHFEAAVRNGGAGARELSWDEHEAHGFAAACDG